MKKSEILNFINKNSFLKNKSKHFNKNAEISEKNNIFP